ncbi:conjugal transfer protein MobC [Pedobacter sp. SYP-B3415]|uniref:conjugal transfer protein MobC n=1 Tax=Pedobacter sp. SYP-B3415 TaxID=2496641 RepID=UPI00101C9E7E|nr:conjugal transfer protein MobC [Pedobacter sp. SYP-B3415]
MNTGEDTTGLRKIADLARMISFAILLIHLWLINFHWIVAEWGASDFLMRITRNLSQLRVFSNQLLSKCFMLVFLMASLLAVSARKDESLRGRDVAWLMGYGLALFFGSAALIWLVHEAYWWGLVYSIVMVSGYLMIIRAGVKAFRLMKLAMQKDIFNRENETFPQEERYLSNSYSVNLPTRYQLKQQWRDSWINIINPFRGILVAGTPGAGKSYFVVRHIIDQHLAKGFSMFIYDFKFDDLTKIAYNKLLKYADRHKIVPRFFVINFDDLSRTHRCNPLDPASMDDVTDATEASRTIMMGLNRDWIKKQGDFFVESPINFLTAIIWFLRRYENGKYCSLPHVIELMQADYQELFDLLETQEEIKVLINPFISAYRNKAMEQLEGQIASAKIGLARLSSPQLYYVLSGDDFTLDINNPEEPKVVCVGNNPQKLQVYGAVLSLYISRMIKLVNRKGQLQSSLVFDEFPTIFFNNMDSLIATARSNRVATTLAVQDLSQLRKDYGKEQADVIAGIVGNLISGQVTGDTAKSFSESFGKIMQDRTSTSTNSSDISVSKSLQLEYAVPAAKIAGLSSGEFVGMVADNPEEKIALKLFHCQIKNDHQKIKAEEASYMPLPVVKMVSEEDVQENYLLIKQQVRDILDQNKKEKSNQDLAKSQSKTQNKRVKSASSGNKR